VSFEDDIHTNSTVDNSASFSKRVSTTLTFSPDHDLCTLWTLWSGVSCKDNPLKLNLPACGSPSHLPLEEMLVQESQRLWLALTQAAHRRIQAIAAVPSSSPVNLDEEAFLHVSKDELAAWLFLFPAIGEGKHLSPSRLHQVVMEHGVTGGVNWSLLWRFSTLPQRCFLFFPPARGKDPVPGMDGRIVDRYPRSFDENVRVEELDQADYKTLNLVRNIQEGDVICEIVPATKGIPGATVTGKALPAKDGKDPEIPQGRNTCISQGGRYLLAERNGHVAFSGREFLVKPVLHLTEEDLAAKRNVNFLGDIHIHCDLENGVSVRATGTIQIDGAVEVCTVEAGEHIIVSGGVQGQGRTELHAQKSVYAKYLEYCNVYARNSVQADCIINCNIYSNGTVKVTTGRGVIVGGVIRSSGEVTAGIVGSKAERPTSIILGGQPCEEAERAQVSGELEEIRQELARTERLPSSPEQAQKVAKLRLNLYVAKGKLEAFGKELESHTAPTVGADIRRMRCATVYPGTTVTVYHSSFRVTQEKQNCTIGVVDGLVNYL
jgi:uncharacterized protein (DUF342 family)